jgi:SAM-dependent methyltransferase
VACGTLFVADPPSEADLTAYYNSAYAVTSGEVSVERFDAWTDLIRLAEQHVDPGQALEVGASGGHFLRLLERQGWHASGVELDARAREAHARRSPAIPMYESLDAARDAGSEALDLVIALHTIEHLRAPRAFLDSVRDLLRQGGVLMLTTPNGGSVVRWLAGSRWEWWTPPAHLALFTPAGLSLALRDCGFEVLEVRTRRGDANGTASNLVLAPLRALKRRMRGTQRQAISERSTGRRLSSVIDTICDPPTAALRRRAYASLLGPELIVIARAVR